MDDDAGPDDLDDAVPQPDEHGRYPMDLSAAEVTVVLASRAARRAVRAVIARVRR